ncbi:hypothetical protein BD779DRAFT_1680369 [Infundibulicybe gibba]|nr:hypothetical protein BD779DRAFT_1680369 [Infundibulicybe gibba]
MVCHYLLINGSWFLTSLHNVRRIWFLNSTTAGRIFAASIGVTALLQLLLSILLPALFPSLVQVDRVFLALIISDLASDIFITSSMLYILHKVKRQSLFRGTETIISRLMVNAVQTGAITTIAASIGFALMFTEEFSNVCLVNLNMRAQTRRLGGDVQFLSTAHSDVRRGNSTLRFTVQATSLAQSRADPEGNAEMRYCSPGSMSSAGFESGPARSLQRQY